VARSQAANPPSALIATAEDGTIRSWNHAAEVLFGYAAAEVIGRSVFDTIVAPDHANATRERFRIARRANRSSYEAVRRRKDGVFVWVKVALRVTRERDGTRVIVLNERDITRARYRREARAMQTRFRGLLEAVPDAFALVDTIGRIALVNSATERLFGYARDELLGELVETLMPSRYHRRHESHRARYFADPRTRPMGSGLELWGRSKNGAEFPVEISLSPLTIGDSRLAIAAIRDATARKRTEEALRLANSELESFTYSVSHDLRAPIRQIDGFSRMLTERLGPDASPALQHYLARIREGTQYMGRLVDDLLNLSRIGRQALRPRQVDLGDVARAAITGLQADASGRDIEWRLERLPVVACDPSLVKLVFINLLSNALKYTRPRTHVVIEIGPVSRNGHEGAFVRDNGVGFDMQYADKLFGVFQRLHRADEFEGTGVGLATVQRIVHKHGGDVWGEADLDRGATFSFTLGEPHASPGAPEP
jgi:PAS domain S-box-containing protein